MKNWGSVRVLEADYQLLTHPENYSLKFITELGEGMLYRMRMHRVSSWLSFSEDDVRAQLELALERICVELYQRYRTFQDSNQIVAEYYHSCMIETVTTCGNSAVSGQMQVRHAA
jgi:hypothetical protein